MDLSLDFRAEAGEWLARSFPAELRGKPELGGTADEPPSSEPAVAAWREAVATKGWGVPDWPVRYGGAGLDAAQIAILSEEYDRVGAWNPVGGMGVTMLGPTLLQHGSEEQKARFLPSIADGSIRWCQGYSEPGAGSDLASLRCRAEDRGDHYLVNGQKTWTSGAQWADWCFALVRTDAAHKQGGISFLLIDMRSPGVEVQPIRLISGSSPFCDTFFTDVRVPKANRVGAENGGWSIGMSLLHHERTGISASSRKSAKTPRPLSEIAKEYGTTDGEGRLADAELRRRLVALDMEQVAFDAATADWVQRYPAGSPGGGSMLKNIGTRLTQERAELLVDIMGLAGLAGEGDDFTADERAAGRTWLFSRAISIYGGTTEIQNNIMAKRFLGLGVSA